MLSPDRSGSSGFGCYSCGLSVIFYSTAAGAGVAYQERGGVGVGELLERAACVSRGIFRSENELAHVEQKQHFPASQTQNFARRYPDSGSSGWEVCVISMQLYPPRAGLWKVRLPVPSAGLRLKPFSPKPGDIQRQPGLKAPRQGCLELGLDCPCLILPAHRRTGSNTKSELDIAILPHIILCDVGKTRLKISMVKRSSRNSTVLPAAVMDAFDLTQSADSRDDCGDDEIHQEWHER